MQEEDGMKSRLAQLGSTMRVLRPYPNVFAFYDGRIEGKRAYSEERNWLDDGAYVLGISTYAIVEGAEALVYDTHISLAHARIIRETLERRRRHEFSRRAEPLAHGSCGGERGLQGLRDHRQRPHREGACRASAGIRRGRP